jgi:hypothetical protein
MAKSGTSKVTVDVTLGGMDCSGDYHWTAEELETVSKVFARAALALRLGQEGCVFSKHPDGYELASVSIDRHPDQDRPHDYETPVITEFDYPAPGGEK